MDSPYTPGSPHVGTPGWTPGNTPNPNAAQAFAGVPRLLLSEAPGSACP